MKSGFVSIVGRPNVGKSTLLNSLLETKLAITSNKAGTTRNLIQGIYRDEDCQIVFVDTPGIHKPLNQLGNLLNRKAYEVTNDVDLILFLVDVSTGFGKGDEFILNRLKGTQTPVILILNKIDKIKKEGIQLAKTEFNPNSGIEYAECIRYLGIGFLDLIEQLNNRQEAYSLFKKLGRKAFCPIRTMSKILDYEKPDLVILTADVRYEKATGLASNSLNIPVLHIHDLPEMQKLSYKADICVMNKYAYKFAIENKIGSPE